MRISGERQAREVIERVTAQNRRVENNYRLPRSARTARAGDIEGLTAERPCNLARNSSTDGRSATRRISRNK